MILFGFDPLIFEAHEDLGLEQKVFFSDDLISVEVCFGENPVFDLFMVVIDIFDFVPEHITVAMAHIVSPVAESICETSLVFSFDDLEI